MVSVCTRTICILIFFFELVRSCPSFSYSSSNNWWKDYGTLSWYTSVSSNLSLLFVCFVILVVVVYTLHQSCLVLKRRRDIKIFDTLKFKISMSNKYVNEVDIYHDSSNRQFLIYGLCNIDSNYSNTEVDTDIWIFDERGRSTTRSTVSQWTIRYCFNVIVSFLVSGDNG